MGVELSTHDLTSISLNSDDSRSRSTRTVIQVNRTGGGRGGGGGGGGGGGFDVSFSVAGITAPPRGAPTGTPPGAALGSDQYDRISYAPPTPCPSAFSLLFHPTKFRVITISVWVFIN